MPVYRLTNESISFPPVELASPSGLLALYGDLSVKRLLHAYSLGIFPWYNEGEPILWWSPPERMLLFPQKFKASHSFKRVIKSGIFEVRIDNDFDSVIRKCSEVKRKGEQGTWISNEIIEAYSKLYREGYAHSFETYRENRLVGGLYGVSLGKAFFGESMFSEESNASKMALFYLCKKMMENGFHFIDAQQNTSHLASLGAESFNRNQFLSFLNIALKEPTLKKKWTTL